jgi:hypothetical protein
MLAEEPGNQNLMDLRDQLTNAINQLQGTKNMVQRAQSSRQPGMLPHGIIPGLGPDGRNKVRNLFIACTCEAHCRTLPT